MPLAIQSGILKSLGINLYTNLGKVLVEFIANAYDGDAEWVKVTIPFDRIAEERAKAKTKADAEAAAAAAKLDLATLEALPELKSQPTGLNLESLFQTVERRAKGTPLAG